MNANDPDVRVTRVRDGDVVNGEDSRPTSPTHSSEDESAGIPAPVGGIPNPAGDPEFPTNRNPSVNGPVSGFQVYNGSEEEDVEEEEEDVEDAYRNPEPLAYFDHPPLLLASAPQETPHILDLDNYSIERTDDTYLRDFDTIATMIYKYHPSIVPYLFDNAAYKDGRALDFEYTVYPWPVGDIQLVACNVKRKGNTVRVTFWDQIEDIDHVINGHPSKEVLAQEGEIKNKWWIHPDGTWRKYKIPAHNGTNGIHRPDGSLIIPPVANRRTKPKTTIAEILIYHMASYSGKNPGDRVYVDFNGERIRTPMVMLWGMINPEDF